MGFFGFNNKKRSSLGGDFDGDGVKNRKDCEPLNWKKQDGKKTRLLQGRELLEYMQKRFGYSRAEAIKIMKEHDQDMEGLE